MPPATSTGSPSAPTAESVCAGREAGAACAIADSQGTCQAGQCCQAGADGPRAACHDCLTCVPTERPLELVVLPAFPTAAQAPATPTADAAAATAAVPPSAGSPAQTGADGAGLWVVGALLAVAAVAALWWRGRTRS